ncbi:MAG: hypothetical protein KAH32_04690 [Chlamydiia bacterium]|nr:hypothetical protein [Chlamydiia bacterium]
MFNLGYKEVILNSGNGVTGDSSVLSIEGYGTFKQGQTSNPIVTPSEDAVGEESKWDIIAPPHLVIGDSIEVVIDIRTSREIGDLARDFITDGKKIIFQSTNLTGLSVADIEMAISEGWALFVERNSLSEWYINVEPYTIGAGTDGILGTEDDVINILKDDAINIEVLPKYEHVTVKSVRIKRSAVCVGATNCFIKLKKEVTVEGNEGVGLGKWLEESRRMSTPQNSMAYSASHGGNSQGVNVRGKYKTYSFDFDGEDSAGWRSHEYVDHSYVNAEMTSKPTHYVIYANESDTELISILDAFVV